MFNININEKFRVRGNKSQFAQKVRDKILSYIGNSMQETTNAPIIMPDSWNWSISKDIE